MSAPILQVRELTKAYPGVNAVQGIDFDIPEGICFGMLGPNGAGKTTTVEIMEGIVSPTSGAFLYRGSSIDRRFREEIGIQFQATALQDFLTVQETLEFFRRLYQHTADLDETVTACALHDLLGRDNRKLSGGQRQRLLLAIALLNDPEVLFLDEPTTGLDPQSRRNFWHLIQAVKQKRKTIVLTTHYMEEAYQLCDVIIIMDHGRIIAQGSPADLLAQHFGDSVVQIPRADFAAVPTPDLPFTVLEAREFVEISTHDIEGVMRALLAFGVPLGNVQVRPRTLDDLFLELTGKELRA